MKRAIWILPKTCWPPVASSTDTVPSRPKVTLDAVVGMVMAGCRGAPAEVTRAPVEDTLKLPSRV